MPTLSTPHTADIIIPHYGATHELAEKCLACLRSIRTYTSKRDYRIILVDNASPADQFERVMAELELHPHMLIRNTQNTGFIKATNAGLAISSAPYVVLLNNDTRVAPAWLEKLLHPLVGLVGMSGPRTTTTRSWQGRVKESSGVRILGAGCMLAFFCVALRREVIEKVGYLDEDFGHGLGDDDWYCLQVQRKGWQLALVQDLVIAHDHRSTFHTLHTEDEVKALQEAALEIFYKKRRGEHS